MSTAPRWDHRSVTTEDSAPSSRWPLIEPLVWKSPNNPSEAVLKEFDAYGDLVAQAVAVGAPAQEVLLTTTQADLAKLAGSSRESASRFLAVLERAGVISQGRGRLVVHDPSALEGYVF